MPLKNALIVEDSGHCILNGIPILVLSRSLGPSLEKGGLAYIILNKKKRMTVNNFYLSAITMFILLFGIL